MGGVNGRALCQRLYQSASLCLTRQCGKGPWRTSGSNPPILQRTVRLGQGTDLPAHVAAVHSFQREVHREYIGNSECRGQVVLRRSQYWFAPFWVYLNSHQQSLGTRGQTYLRRNQDSHRNDRKRKRWTHYFNNNTLQCSSWNILHVFRGFEFMKIIMRFSNTKQFLM